LSCRTVHVTLPASCGRHGFVALLRRLYSLRRWPVAAWAQQGLTAASEAAQLADMWLLSDISREAQLAAESMETNALSHSEALPREVVRGMLFGLLANEPDDELTLELAEHVLDYQIHLGSSALDDLIAVMDSDEMLKEFDVAERRPVAGMPTGDVGLRSLAFFTWLCRVMSWQCREHAPQRLGEVALAVERVGARIVDFAKASGGRVDWASSAEVLAGLQLLLEMATESSTMGDLPSSVFESAILRLSDLNVISAAQILALREQAQIDLIQRAMNSDGVEWFTLERVSSFRGKARFELAKHLLPHLSTLDVEVAQAIVSSFVTPRDPMLGA